MVVEPRLSRKLDIKLMTPEEKASTEPYLLDYINYRKSGLSLNHIIGCPLDCAYCVRHFWKGFDMKKPQMICSDDEAIDSLVNHPFFVPHKTPIQLFNKATDPFVPGVNEHTHYILGKLDGMQLTNQVLVITRAKVTEEDMERLESLRHIKVTLLFTYSGITDKRIEPIAASRMTVQSIKTAARLHNRTKIVLYWRPIVAGWNDDEDTMQSVLTEVGTLVDAIVFTGYYHRAENAEYMKEIGVELPYSDDEVQRRKLMPADLEQRIINAHQASGIDTPLFRKTSCGIAYAHEVPDYNGHWGVRELCDICPVSQQQICDEGYKTPSDSEFAEILKRNGYDTGFLIEDGQHVWTSGLGEPRRYHLQHMLGFQIWDIDTPHFKFQHGRGDIGYEVDESDRKAYQSIRDKFLLEEVLNKED